MAINNNSEETQHYSNKLKVQFSLKWKISLVFSIVFSVIFLLTLEGVSARVANEADLQIKTDLTQALEGAAQGCRCRNGSSIYLKREYRMHRAFQTIHDI